MHVRTLDIRAATRFAAIFALLVGAWFLVRMLKPREAELTGFDSRNAQFGDMSSAAEKRTRTAEDDPTSGLDMVPSSSLPVASPQEPAPPAPAEQPAQAAAPAPAPEPAPAPAPARKQRVRPAFQKVESAMEGQAATTSAFMAAPQDAKQESEKKKK
ncbi:MAG: hypothetical protein HY928_08165 [Elusimicrobia bacterium]|nr:hypothetical protein [Elusimicrobiota bacterium]